MDDLISRQSVKEWLGRWEGYLDTDMIARMQLKVDDIPTHPTPSNTLGALDCVERQAAIDVALTFFVEFLDGAFHEDDQRKLIALYEQLPSTQPREGKISYTKFCEELWGQSSICSLCGCSWQIAEDGDDNFCPNCGADMRGDSHD